MSEIIQKFSRDVLEWVDAGCPHHEVFNRRCGLCTNSREWAFHKDYDVDSVYDKLKQRLPANPHHDESTFPFNDDGGEGYWQECKSETNHCYTNEKRLAWLRKQVGDAN